MPSSRIYTILITAVLFFGLLLSGFIPFNGVQSASALAADPTKTPTPTPLPSATPTPTPDLFGAEGVSAWCLPENTSSTIQKSADPANPPAYAGYGKFVNGALEVEKLPYSRCFFIYTFSSPAAEGMKLEVNELRNKSPWLKLDLLPVEGHPNSVAASTNHTYIVVPPYYDISYYFTVRDASGKEVRRDQVNLHRWKPKLCWNGIYPSLKTGLCNLKQDLHPWDPGYRTPIPTDGPDD